MTTIYFKLAGKCNNPAIKIKHNNLEGFEVLPRVGEKFSFLDDPGVYKVSDISHVAGYDEGGVLAHTISISLTRLH